MRINIPNHDRKRLQHRLCHGLFVSTLCFFSKSSRICFKVSCFSTKLSCNASKAMNASHRCTITHLHSTLLLFVIGNILVNLSSQEKSFKKTHTTNRANVPTRCYLGSDHVVWNTVPFQFGSQCHLRRVPTKKKTPHCEAEDIRQHTGQPRKFPKS